MDFVEFMENSMVTDVGFSGSQYTWCNNRGASARIYKRLDRVLVSSEWLALGVNPSVQHLSRVGSDHSPLYVSFHTQQFSVVKPFRFLSLWVKHQSFKSLIKESWDEFLQGRPMIRLFYKLKRLKGRLKLWSKETFGNILEEPRKREEEINSLENELQNNFSDQKLIELNAAKASYSQVLNAEMNFWRQKARLKWFKEGDANTRFFQSTVASKRLRLRIHRIKNNSGEWMESPRDIAEAGVDFFKDLLTDSSIFYSGFYGHLESVLQCIPKVLSEEETQVLENVPDLEELQRAVFAMDPDSAPGPDGFPGLFFQNCWDIVSSDVLQAVQEFFLGGDMPKGYSATLLTLIPKVAGPSSFADFRPISLCNFIYKIISKVLSIRLEKVLPKLISPQQSGFVQGRLITDNVLLAQEMTGYLTKRTRGANVMLKLDMAKAYDRVSWIFLISVMRKFGFSEIWLDMIWRLISGCHFSLLINGESHGFFHSTRGLRQGDPLSPALFILAAEVFSRSLNGLPNMSGFKPYSVSLGCPVITHLAYADDILIFSSADKRSLRCVQQVIKRYETVSGQLVNMSKSCFVIGPKASRNQRDSIAEIMGFSQKMLPIRYLGCPLYIGRKKRSYFSGIVDNIRSRITGWSKNLLSVGGRMVLVNHVLASIPIFLLSAMHPPKGVIQDIEKLFANFLWGETEYGHRFHWMRWNAICRPKDEGGAGFRSLSHIALAFDCKLWWRFRQGGSLWAEFMCAKYVKDSHPVDCMASSTSSHVWKTMIQCKDLVEDQTVWEINSGIGISMFWDNWMGTGALWGKVASPTQEKVSDFLIEDRWDSQKLSLIFTQDLVQQICAHPIVLDPVSPDEMLWKLTPDGTFSVKTAYEMVRPARVRDDYGSKIWHSGIPLKLSFFVMLLLQGKISLDVVLYRFHIFGPSKCSCCVVPDIETVNHVFSFGMVASQVWKYFETAIGVSYVDYNIHRRCRAWWWELNSSKKPLKLAFQFLPIFICWSLWKGRNIARHNGKHPSVSYIIEEVWWGVFQAILLIFSRFKTWSGSWLQFIDLMEGLSPKYHITKVVWQSSRRFKLNTDGSCFGNPGPGAGGGLLRDEYGGLVFAFYGFFGHISSLEAEARALCLGLFLCNRSGLQSICIECDSEVLVQMYNGSYKVSWFLRTLFKKISRYKRIVDSAVHCYREANAVADALARRGQQEMNFCLFQNMISLPEEIRNLIYMDSMNVCSFRRTRTWR